MTKTSTSERPTAPKRDTGRGGLALLIIDMINCFEFAGADKLRARAAHIAERIVGLRAQIRAAGAPVIYVNDNFGEWHSEKSLLVERAIKAGSHTSEKLAPKQDDYFIIKPQFSGFYATNLPVLLPKLGVSRLILTGIATDICVLFTAADAHMRDYALWIPEDAVAADGDRSAWALDIMRSSMSAETRPTTELAPQDWLALLDQKGVR